MDKTLIILGAGATVGSGYKLENREPPPYDNNFFDYIDIKKNYLSELEDKDGKIKTRKNLHESFKLLWYKFNDKNSDKNPGLEEFWNTVVLNTKFVAENLIDIRPPKEVFGKFPYDQPPNVKIVRWVDYYMRVLLQEIYAEQLQYDKVRLDEDNFKKLFEKLDIKGNKNKFSFISFNYDLCLEHSLRNSEIEFHYPNFSGADGVPIYKLHGSLNWWHGFDGDISPRSHNDILKPIRVDENNYGKEFLFESWKQYQPAIIPPDFLKEEFHYEEGQKKLHRHFLTLWTRAGVAIAEAKKIIIIGYRFPPADPHAKWLVRAAHAGLFGNQSVNSDKPDKNVFLVTTDDNSLQPEDLRCLFSAQKIEPCTKGFEKCFNNLLKWWDE